MSASLFRIAAFVLCLGSVPLSTAAQDVTFLSDDAVDISGRFGDLMFIAGGTLDIAVETPDDLFVAGGDVDIDDTAADHLIVAGGNLTLDGVRLRDVVAAAGSLTIESSIIADDVIAAAGQITLEPDVEVGGVVILAAGTVTLEATVQGDVFLSGGRTELDGVVVGDVEVNAEQLIIGPNARIAGRVLHRTGEVDISPEAQIDGDIIAEAWLTDDDSEDWMAEVAAGASLVGLGVMLGFILGVAVVAVALSRIMEGARAALSQSPVKAVGAGFLVLVITPAAIMVLMITVVGMPLALFTVLAFIPFMLLAIAASIYVLGQWARSKFVSGAIAYPGLGARFGWTALAALVLVLFGMIPILGSVAWVLVFVTGLGALAAAMMRAQASSQ